jgi:acyl carrier protein
MSDNRERLQRCFSAVFPALSADQIAQASPEETEAWDSLASLTLLEVVDEEFGVRIDPFEFAEVASFDRMLAYLDTSTSGR